MEIRLKRFLSLAMAIIMVVGMMPTNVVFATENTECEHTAKTKTTVEATCTENGSVTETCDACGAVTSQTVIGAGHKYEEEVTKAPTCTEAGEKKVTCTVCGDTKTEPVAKADHTFNEGVVTTEATCTEAGEKKVTCTVCGDTKTEAITATGHDFVEGICSICEEADPNAVAEIDVTECDEDEHEYNANSDACTVCGHTVVKVGKGYKLFILNGDGTVAVSTDGSKSGSVFCLKTTLEDARAMGNNGFLFGITGTPSYVVFMYEDSTEKQDFTIESDVTIYGNGHKIVCDDGVAVGNQGTLIDATIISKDETPMVPDVPACEHLTHGTDGKCECGATVEHTYTDGKCTVCGADDPDYVAPAPTEVVVATLAELQEALADNSNNLPIVVTETITIPAGETVTLNLNGKKITATDNKAANVSYDLFYNYGTLTVTGNGTIELISTSNDTAYAKSSSIFQNRGGVLVIQSGTFTHKGGTAMAYVVDNNANSYGDATTTIKGGNLSSTYVAIRNRMDTYGANGGGNGVATLNIEGGSLSGKRAVWGQVSSAGCKGNITITGGNFSAWEGEPAVRVGTDETGEIVTAISGGTFSSDVTEFLADGYVQNENGTVTVAPSEPEAPTEVKVATLAELQAALADTSNDLPIVVTASIEVGAGEAIVLDLNGKTVSASGMNVLRNNAGGKLTIKNGVVTRSGDTAGYAVSNDNSASTMIVENATINGGVYTSGGLTVTNANINQRFASRHVIYASGCEVKLNSGNYHNYNAGNATIFVTNGATVTIDGGTFSIDNGKQTVGWTSNLIDVANGNCVINGGTIKGHFRVQGNGILNINGGTFENTHGENHVLYTGYAVVVKGGTFVDDSFKTFAGSHLAEGYELGEDGTVIKKQPAAPAVTVDEVKVVITDNGNNSYDVVLGAEESFPETGVTMTFPATGDTNGMAYVVHEHAGKNYIYVGKVAGGKFSFKNTVGFSTFTVADGGLADAIAAAESGATVNVIADISDEAITVDKNLTITGSAKLNNVTINALNAAELTVSGLTFTGNSWINSAAKLSVSGVTANVAPSNSAYTNSRNAFISLGRDEGKDIEITVKNSTICTTNNADAINGWARIIKADISGNNFGSENAKYGYGTNVVKIMGVATNAELTFAENTVYADFNGFAIAPNNTRDNHYTVIFDGNKFFGTADFMWIETQLATYTYAAVNATSDNTINGNAITAADIKTSETTWYCYAGLDVVTDENGKVIGGTLAYYAEDAIADGYEVKADGTVVETAPAYVAEVNGTKYETLAAALAAVTSDNQTVVILTDITENLTGAYLRGNIVTKDNAKVTITLTNNDWVYCPYTFILGENITLNVPYLFYYAGGTVIKGKVVAGAYYQRYAGTKLTIEAPGSMTVTTEMCYLRYVDGDPNAGIYIVGDNDDSTVELMLDVAYFYQGMINAKDATIQAGVYWQTQETDGQGSANLVLDNSKLNVTVNEQIAKATGNSTVTLKNGSVVRVAGGYQGVGITMDDTSTFTKNGVSIFRAKVDDVAYTTLADAVAAAESGDTITLLADVNLGEALTLDKAVTLDGNGKTITADLASGAIVIKSSNVTVKNLTIDQGTKDNSFGITIDKGAWNAPAVQYSNITVENVDFVDGDYALCLIGENVVVDGCTFTNQDSHNIIVYSLKGDSKIINNTFNASKGSNKSAILYEGGADNATDLSGFIGGGKLTISGNTANAKGVFFQFTNWKMVEGMNLAITGNTVDGTTNKVIALYDMDGAITAAGNEFASVVINNNAFTNTAAGRPVIKEYTGTVTVDASANYLGSETPDVAALMMGEKVKVESYYADEALTNLVEIKKPVASVNGVKYETLAAAIAAAQANDTITLLADVKLTGKLTITKAITIDGNGHSIIADETAVWYTVSGKLNIKSYKTHLIGVNSDNITLKDVILDCNNNAAGINVYCAQNVTFDNVSIINATKGMAALTVNGSTVTFKNAFTALGNSIALDISNGSGVTSALGVTVEEGTVFDLGNKTVKFASVANNEVTNAVDANGEPYFAAMDNAYYYTEAQMESRTADYSNGLTLLKDVELTKDLKVKGTLNLNGHTLTMAEGKSVILTDKTTTVVGPEGLNVTTSIADHRVVYENGVYKLVAISYVASVTDANGNETKFESLAEAFAAAEDGDTITLLADISLSSILTIDKAITLDGNGKTLTSTATRAINVSGANGVTVKNLTINTTGERAINIIQNATNVTIDNVTATAANYTVNVASSAPNAVVAIKNSNLTGLNVVNVGAKDAQVTVNGGTITCNDQNEKETYAALFLNADAVGATITATGVTLEIKGDSFKATSVPVDGQITIDGSTDGVRLPIAYISYGDYAYTFYSLADAIATAQPDETVVLLRDVTSSAIITIDKAITLDGNGKTLTSTAGRAINVDTEGAVEIKNLTINASGERAINVINKPAKVTVDNVTATANNNAIMIATSAGAVELSVNDSKLTGLAVINVAGAGAQVAISDTTITNVDKSKNEIYGAITVWTDAKNAVVNVSGGEIIVADDSEKAIVFAPSATVNGVDDVRYIVATIGDGGYYTIESAIRDAKAGNTITLQRDVTASEIITIDKAITLDGNGKTLTSTAARAINVSGANGATIKNLTISTTGERAINVIGNATNVTIDNVTATAANYTVNVAASAPNAVVAINNSTLNGLCTVNVASAGADVKVDNSTINCNDNNTTAGESYAALCLNKAAVGGKIIATNTNVNVPAGSDSTKGRNGAEDGIVTINGSTEGVTVTVAVITYANSDYYHGFTSIADAIKFAKAGETITLIRDVTASEIITIDKAITLDLNSKTITDEQIILTDAAAVLTAPESLNVTTDVADHKVVYDEENKQYKVVAKVYVAEVNGVEYETLADAVAAAQANDTITLLADATVEGTLALPAGIKLTSNGHTINGSIRMLGDLTLDGPLTITGGLWVGKSGETLTATLSGDKLTANYFMFQRGTYTIDADIDAVYGYLSFGGEFQVNSTITTTNTNGEPLYLNGNIDLNKDAALNVKYLYLSNANTVLNVAAGASVNATDSVKLTMAGAQLYSAGDIRGAISKVDGSTIALSGGTYTTNIPAEWCVKGYIPVDNGNGTYGVKVALPEVVITDIKSSLKDTDPDLTFALNFAIKDVDKLTEEYLEDLMAAYGDHYVDYVLTISGLTDESVTFNSNGEVDGYLAGQYDAWSENWLSVPFEDVTIANGQSLYIMEYAAKLMGKQGLRFTLTEVAAIVQNFDCGVYFTPEFLSANPDMKVDLQLKVFTEDENGNKVDNIDVAENNFEVKNIAAIITGENQQTQYFATLADAIAAAEAGDTVTLMADIALDATVKIPAGKTVTLDLNGKIIDGTEKVRIALMSYGNLTLKDSSAEQTGIIKAGIGTAGNAVNICGGTFTMESGSIYSKNNALLIDENASTVNIKGGKLTAEPTTNNSAVMYISGTNENVINITGGEMVGYNGILLWNNTTVNMNAGSIKAQGSTGIQGNGSKDNTKITISGGEISGYYAAIYHPQGGELTISGGKLTGWTGVVVKGGKVNISGGTIAGTGEADTYRPVSSGYVDTGDGLYVEVYDNSTNSENYGKPEVTVTGGIITSVNGNAVASYANTNNNVEALDAFISGGTFSSDVTDLCVAGYKAEKNDDGTYGVKVALPEVVITDIKSSLKDTDPDLTFALNFAIKDVDKLTEEYLEDLMAAYGDHYVDYVLTISGLSDPDVTFNSNGEVDGYLAGQYDAWSENWLSVPFEDVTIANGESLYIMEYAAKLMGKQGLRFTLTEVAAIVQNFDCGVYFTPEFLSANPNMKVDLQLKVFTEDENGNKVDNIDVAENNFEVKNIAAIITGENQQTQYFATLADAIAAAEANDTITLLANVTLSETLDINKSITLALNSKTITGEEIVLTDAAAVLTAPEGLNVTTNVADHKVVYENGTYSVEKFIPTGSIPNKSIDMTLSLQHEIYVNVYFKVDGFEGYEIDPADIGLLAWDTKFANMNDCVYDNADRIVDGGTYNPETKEFRVQSKGIAAKNMADDAWYRIYIRLPDGSYVYSSRFTYKPEKYCNDAVIKDLAPTAELKALCVALMNYGAEAQKYFAAKGEYSYTTLMNEAYADYQNLVKEYSSDMIDALKATTASKHGEFVLTKGYFSRYDTTASLKGALYLNVYMTCKNTNYTEAGLLVWDEETYNNATTLTWENATNLTADAVGGAEYKVSYTGIAAKDIGKTIYACAYMKVGDSYYYTGVFTTNIEQYAKKAIELGVDEAPVMKALSVYSEHAKENFNK